LFKTDYSLTKGKKQFESQSTPTAVYGIRADICGSGKTIYEIEDFSLSEDYTLRVISLLKKENPEPVHIAEIIEDFL